jgi:ankyrin repeat protein
MEQKPPGSSQGYQKKQIDKNIQPPSPSKKKETHDYSSPTAKKIPLFMEAISNGEVSAVQKFIEEGVNVNIARSGVTPLMLAASKGHHAVVQAILQAGANINEKSDDGWTALHKAAYDQAETAVVDLLMESGIDIEAKTRSGKTALQLAEETRHQDIVRIFKKRQQQASIDAQDWKAFLNSAEGKPFKLSRRHESLALLFKLWWLPLLLLGGAGFALGIFINAVVIAGGIGLVTGICVSLPLLIMGNRLRAYLKDIEPLPYLDIHMVREKRRKGEPIIVEKRRDRKPAEETAEGVTHAAEEKAERIINAERAHDRGRPALSASARRALRIAVYAVAALIIVLLVALLIRNKGDITQWYYAKKLERAGVNYSEKAFLNAVSTNNGEAVNLFLQAGMKLDARNEQGQTALFIASEKGLVNIVAGLLQRDAGLARHTDAGGNSALMAAARQGHEAVVQLLIERGADVNYMVPSREGAASALQAALDAPDFKEAHMNIIRQLLHSGADVKGRNSAGRSPLLFAADHGRWEAAGLLIEKGADVNEADLKGGFPLLIAACNGDDRFAGLLLEKGANLAVTTPDGHTPLMCASQGGHGGVVSLLLIKGANVNAKTATGSTALTAATRTGNAAVAQLLLARGADHSRGYVPDTFKNLRGRTAAVNARKIKNIGDVLGILSKTAVQDGYTIKYDANKMGQKTTMKAKGPWNRLLSDLAAKNRFVLVVKDKSVAVLP